MRKNMDTSHRPTHEHLLRRMHYLLIYIAFVLSVAALLQALQAAGVIG